MVIPHGLQCKQTYTHTTFFNQITQSLFSFETVDLKWIYFNFFLVAPIARDESCYDIGSTSPSVTSAYDNDLAETPNVNFKGFPYIDGAPSRKQPQKMEVTEAAKASNNFSLLVDKSTQTPEEKLQRKAKEACAIL